MTDTRLYIQAQKLKLSNGITLSDTSIALESFNLPNGTAIESGDLGTINYATIEPGTSNEEQISFTGISGTTLTGVTRGLDFTAPYTAVSGNRKAHAAGSILVISNTAAFYDNFLNKNNDETITGIHTFTASALPQLDTYAAPTADAQFAAKKYVDDVAAGGTASIDRVVVAGTAGETIAAGNVVYFDATDKEWKLADASASATSENVILGVAQGAGTNGVAILGGVLLAGLDTNQTGMTAGTKQFLSDTAGELSESAGTKEVSLGYSQSGSTTNLIFAPGFDQKITEDIQDAIGGNSGSPSSTNTLVTQLGLQRNQEVYAASTTGDDTYVVTLSPVPAAYVDGMVVFFKPDTANTGACTLNVNSLGAITIKKNVSDDLADGDIPANAVVAVIYDGTNFQMISTPASAAKVVDIQEFTVDGTWTKPAGAKKVLIQGWGGGGAGGRQAASAGAAGGGGGEYRELWLDADDMSATEAVVAGTGAAGRTSNGNGSDGEDSTVGSLFTAKGGGGGGQIGSGSVGGGSGGGGYGIPLHGTGASAAAGNPGLYSGAGGGLNTAGALVYNGGASRFGGAGGAAVVNATKSTPGTSEYGGNGGAASGSSDNADAPAGSIPGGGGGGQCNDSATYLSGAGGDGKVIITSFF